MELQSYLDDCGVEYTRYQIFNSTNCCHLSFSFLFFLAVFHPTPISHLSPVPALGLLSTLQVIFYCFKALKLPTLIHLKSLS